MKFYKLLFTLLLPSGLIAQEWKLTNLLGGYPDSLLFEPLGMYFNKNTIIISDNNRLLEYNYKGDFIKRIIIPPILTTTTLGNPFQEMVFPLGDKICLLNHDRLTVSDTTKFLKSENDIDQFDHNIGKKILKSISPNYSGGASFLVAFDNLIFIPTTNSRSNVVYLFDLQGNFKYKFDIIFKYLPLNNQVVHVDYDSKKNLYFQNYSGGIAVHDSTGMYLKTIESWGNVKWGPFCIDEKDRFYSIVKNELFVLNKRGVKQYSQYLRNIKPLRLFSDKRGSIYMINDNRDQSIFIYKYNYNGDYLGKFGNYPKQKLQLPQSIFVDDQENIFISDREEISWQATNDSFMDTYFNSYVVHHRIQKFDKNLNLKGSFVLSNQPPSRDSYSPPNIIVDKLNNIHLAHRWGDDYDLVQVYNIKGEQIGKYAESSKIEKYNFQQFYGIAIDTLENTYLAERDFHRIIVSNKNKEIVLRFGKKGFQDSTLLNPHGVAVDNEGNIFVIDKSPWVKKFDKKGIFQNSICIENTYIRQFQDFWGLTNMNIDSIVVVKTTLETKKYDSDSFDNYCYYSSITTDEKNNIYIVNKAERKIIILNSKFQKIDEFQYEVENIISNGLADIKVKNGKVYIVYANYLKIFQKKY